MYSLLPEIIAKQDITTVFQPIYDVEQQKLIGYQALSRGPNNSELHCPKRLFEVATQCSYLYEIDSLCRQLAIQRFSEQQLSGRLFLTINPLLLVDSRYPSDETLRMLEKSELKRDTVVLQLSDKSQLPASDLLLHAMQSCREQKLKVAIDDFGGGYSGLQHWANFKPDGIKIDPTLIHGCDTDIVKREILRTLFELGQSTGTRVIAKNIENQAQFDLLSELGMTYAQGHYFAPPSAQPALKYPKSVSKQRKLTQQELVGGTIKQLVTNAPVCQADEKTGKIYKMLATRPHLQCLPVLTNNKPVGIVLRHQLMEHFSETYAHALFDSRAISEFMVQDPLVLDQNTSLDQASLLLTRRDEQDMIHHFIVTKQDAYVGLASSHALLRRITEGKIENARYANPLTLLPGNVPINNKIDALLNANHAFQMAYIDINHFKPFNDVYGFAKGDVVIKLLARIIQSCCTGEAHFIGHIGGDDFIVIFTDCESRTLCQQILDEFARQTRGLFRPEHLGANGYHATSRSGERIWFELMSLSIGVVSPDPQLCDSHHHISQMASEAKKEAKKLSNNHLFYCRRSSA